MPHIITAGPLEQLAALDVHQLYKLRVDVFVHEQRCPYAEIDATDADPQTVHLLAWDAESQELLGTARVFPAAPTDAALADAAGEPHGRERIKIVEWDEMVKHAGPQA